MGQFGINSCAIDTLVLGCTHYPFISDILTQTLDPQVRLVDNGEPVARQTRRMLTSHALQGPVGQCLFLTTGEPAALKQAARRWLQLNTTATALAV